MTGASYRVLLYYCYTPIADPGEMVAEQRELCEKLGLRGRILISREGINGTLSGLAASAEVYMEEMRRLPVLAGMEFKVDPAEATVFQRLSVKERPELVTLGLSGEEDIDPAKITGKHLKPSEFYAAMQEEDVVILDARNRFESDLGRFRGAICPDVEHFRDFPQWIRENLGGQEGKKILTYCTGGIRCEKLSGFLLHEGFADVSQLHGGIINYGVDGETRGRDFEGLCYVFDERIGVEVNRTDTRTVISRCGHCGESSPRYRNCARSRCNAQFFCCERCEEEFGRYCSEECRAGGRSEGRPEGVGNGRERAVIAGVEEARAKSAKKR